jgi:hypothetical protein
MQHMTVTLVRTQTHAPPLVAGSQGNVQALAGGDWMVGWGQEPYLTEFAANGALLLDAHLPSAYESYRVFRMPWSGQPSAPPALDVVTAAHTPGVLYASWNGATGVASWRVVAGASSTSLTPLESVAKTGFETAIALPRRTSPRYVAVQALSAAGAVMGASGVRPVSGA